MKNLSGFIAIMMLLISLSVSSVSAQQTQVAGVQKIIRNGEVALQTIPIPNDGEREPFSEHLNGWKGKLHGEQKVLGGTVLWNTQDATAIASYMAIDAPGQSPIAAWTLNNERISRYSDANNTPLWEFITNPNDGFVDISHDGSVIAALSGNSFYLLNPANGSISYQLTMPDSLTPARLKVARDGSLVLFLASAALGSGTARVYALDPATQTILWTFDTTEDVTFGWTAANISADGSRVVVNNRFHFYVLNSADGSLVWDRFLDNTESKVGISGDGTVLVTGDLAGFVQAWLYDSQAGIYNLMWQYRVPPGTFNNWIMSVDVSADGSTIIAGTLLFLPNGFDGSVMAFDTYGDGTPLWIYGGVGDAVDDIAIADNGSVVAIATWGDLLHTLPDLLVFDVATGAVTFSQNTPGSFFAVDITPDGRRVIAGGKAVHAREFGNGGLLYLVEIDLGGGYISGTVDLTDSGDDSGVLVEVPGTPRSAISDANGNYLIGNVPIGSHTVRASKAGYNFASTSVFVVGDTVSGVNLQLDPFAGSPPTLTATQNLEGAVMLDWGSPLHPAPSPEELARIVDPVGWQGNQESRAATGDTPNASPGISPIPQTTLLVHLISDSIAIYRGLLSGGPYNRIVSLPATQTSYTDSSVFPLQNYYYVVTVFNDSGESAYSNEALGRVNDSLLFFNFDTPQQITAPTIDGVISPGEWDDAIAVDVSDIFGYFSGTPKPQGSAFLYFKFDDAADILYIAGEDFLNTALDDNEGFGLYFDDDNDGDFEPEDALPMVTEGNFWAYWHPTGADLRFRPIYENGAVGDIITIPNAMLDFSDATGHVQGEVAIPMGFIDGYQLQVYGPDKIVGLGAFVLARQGTTPIFNGWWPQTMNNIFNPLYFADVGINVSLVAPPKPPSNIAVSKQGSDLLVTWSDPTEGLNNDPLPVPPDIHVFRNSSPFADVSPGVETLLDDSVLCTAWYQYQFQASIQVDTLTLTGPISKPVGNFACQDPVLTPISYDDGSPEAFFVVSFTYDDNKFAVRFTPTFYPARVIRLETLVNSGAEFDYTIQSDFNGLPGNILAGPYRVHADDANPIGTVSFTVPGADPPEIQGGDFWVVINYLPDSPGAPGIGVDNSSPNANRGKYFTRSGGWVDFSFGNLMVTAFITEPLVGVEEPLPADVPLTYELGQNYPNPFNPETIVQFQIADFGKVKIKIYDILGREVRTLVDKPLKPGSYTVSWDGTGDDGQRVPSGVYFYRLSTSPFQKERKGYVRTRKMVLLR